MDKGSNSVGERELPEDVLIGRNAVTEALRAGRGINKILLADGDREGQVSEIIALAKERGIILQFVERSKIESVAGGLRHQGVMAYVAPVAYAELDDILRKAEEQGLKVEQMNGGVELAEKEIELIQKTSEYAAAVAQAGKDYSPSGIANYCYELTKAFNQFYHDYSILGEEDAKKKQFRLLLAKNVAKTLKNGMALLGIEVPERM
jgi:hypothetical protein